MEVQLANLNGDLVYQFDESNQPIPFTAEVQGCNRIYKTLTVLTI